MHCACVQHLFISEPEPGDTMAEKMAADRLVLDSKDFSAIMYFDIMPINLQGPT